MARSARSRGRFLCAARFARRAFSVLLASLAGLFLCCSLRSPGFFLCCSLRSPSAMVSLVAWRQSTRLLLLRQREIFYGARSAHPKIIIIARSARSGPRRSTLTWIRLNWASSHPVRGSQAHPVRGPMWDGGMARFARWLFNLTASKEGRVRFWLASSLRKFWLACCCENLGSFAATRTLGLLLRIQTLVDSTTRARGHGCLCA